MDFFSCHFPCQLFWNYGRSLKFLTAEGQLQLTHTSQATSWQLGHSKPTSPHNSLAVEVEMKWVSFVFSSPTTSNLSGRSVVFTVWAVPKPFSRGFLHCVPLAPGSLCDWLLGLVVAGSLLPSNAHCWTTSGWQSWKWQAAGEGFHLSIRCTQE